LHFLGSGFWFYLPVFFANISIYIVYSILKLDIRTDLYQKLKGKRIIGEGRSVSGLVFYPMFALLIGILQKRPLEAIYLGVGGVIGCNLSSFVKRRLGLKRGKYVFFIDQTDFIIGSSLIYITSFHLSLEIFVSGIILALILHHLVNGLRNNWERRVKKITNK